MVPGRRFSTRTSARAASVRKASLPRGALRSRATERLFRFSRRKLDDSPSRNGPLARVWSPPSGFSILMTSAPRSASCRVQNGAAMKLPTSSTRIPDSAASASSNLRRRSILPTRPLSGEEALRLVGGAHDRARQIGIRITVAVVDEGGLLQALARMDGAPPLSSQLAQVHQERPGFFNAVAQMVRVPIIPGLGSTLIRRDASVLGAVGVSGGKPEQDLDCAEAGLKTLAK